MVVDKQNIADKVKEIEETEGTTAVPPGYIEVRLSSKGKYGAPPVFHIRNFSVEDLVHLAVSNDEDLAQRTIEFLNGVIWEDIDVSDFHKKELIETLLILYTQYFNGQALTNLDWEATDEDKEYLIKKYGEVQGQNQIDSLDSGEWKPKYDIDLRQLQYYDEDPESFKTQARISGRDGFTCVYSWPRYGDIVKVQKYANIIFKEQDKQFERLEGIIKRRQEAEAEFKKGRNIDLSRVGDATKEEKQKVKDYEEQKLNFMTICMRAIQLKEIRGIDISEMELSERIKYAQDPQLDFATYKAIQKAFNDEVKIGPKPTFKVLDPIKEEYVSRDVDFPIYDIISAIRDSDPVGVTIHFE